ncbi:hypothetical protein [Arthrobacter sp. 18067]|uniref:hypothetical protein n=1 Tax=Arthrobacter sp. 18067 TaxID=2681413 RepID=UPI0013580A26|nr:hypothetical protein [Arthrobacter sp. 18067]
MTPEEIEARRAEAKAWDLKVANLASDHLRHLQQDGRPPVFVFFGTRIEQQRFWRAMVGILSPLRVPLPALEDVIPAAPSRLRGTRRRLIPVHQSYPWLPGRREAADAADAAHLIDALNRSNGWA